MTAATRRAAVCLAAAGALMGGLPLPAQADVVRTAPTAVTSPSPSPSPSPRPAPSDRASALDEAVRTKAVEVATAKQRLEESTIEAMAALELYSQATQALQLARENLVRQQQALDEAEARLEQQRQALGRWARKAYAEGNGLSADPTLATILGGSANDVSSSQYWLRITGQKRGADVDAFEIAQREQQRLSIVSEAANNDAQSALLSAEQLKQSRDAAVKRQQNLVAALQTELAATQRAADAEAKLEAERLAQARAFVARSGENNKITGQVGECTGGQTELYPNGEIPIEALCPLWGAPGHYLRADAAFAFAKLSNAYAATFGEPICVTDSYRSFDEQVRLRAEKPDLAAVPGTSNHGWGTATDLCGGIQTFNTTQHDWMEINAPAFGWFLPAWAQQGGSKPEPWHFEFGG